MHNYNSVIPVVFSFYQDWNTFFPDQMLWKHDAFHTPVFSSIASFFFFIQNILNYSWNAEGSPKLVIWKGFQYFTIQLLWHSRTFEDSPFKTRLFFLRWPLLWTRRFNSLWPSDAAWHQRSWSTWVANADLSRRSSGIHSRVMLTCQGDPLVFTPG